MQVSGSHPDLGHIGHVAYSILVSDLELRSLPYMPPVGFVQPQEATFFQADTVVPHSGFSSPQSQCGYCMLVGHLSDSTQEMLYPALGHNSPALFYKESGYLIIKVVIIDMVSEHNTRLSCLVGLYSLGFFMEEIVLCIL